MESSTEYSASLGAGPGAVAPGSTSVVFSIIIVLVLIVLVYAAFRLFCSTSAQVAGYWTSTDGDLFEVFARADGDLFEVFARADAAGGSGGPQKGDYVVASASGFMGASPTKMYPFTKKGCRSVSIPFPAGTLKGRIGLDRRRILWDYAPSWYRQGI